MPHEDKLTPEQRLRLEAFNQAINATAMTATSKPTLQTVLDNAKRISRWLSTGVTEEGVH